MKVYVKTILSALVLTFFLLVAGGSSEGFAWAFGISIAIGLIGGILQANSDAKKEEEKRKNRQIEIDKAKERNENRLIWLKSSFNAPVTKIINYANSEYILVSEEKSLIMINDHTYNFKDIINYSLSDNSIEIFSPTTSKTTTNTGSMVGRAIVGGVLTGGAGAIIGGATASKTTTTSGGTSRTKHSYTLIITINCLSHPTERIDLGKNGTYANEICSILSIILNRNNG